MTTNNIKFPEKKKFLIPFIKKILKKENKYNIKITKHFFSHLKTKLSKPDKNYIPKKDKEFYFNLPNYKFVNTTYNYYLTTDSVTEIVNYWHELFYDMYFFYVKKNIKEGKTKLATTTNFIELYELEVSENTLIRAFDRFQLNLKQKNTPHN